MVQLLAAIGMLIPGMHITIGHLVHTASMFSAVLEIMSYTLGHA